MTVGHGSDVLRTLLRRFWVLLLGLIWGGALGGLVSLMIPPTYQADVYLMMVTRSQEVENTAAYDYTQAYSRLATIPSIVGPALDDYGVEPTPEGIDDAVTVEVPLNTPVFKITASSKDPEMVADMANDLGDAVSGFIGERLAPGSGYRAVVIAEATSPRRPVSPDWKLNIVASAALGLMLGGMVALFWDDLRAGGKGAPESNGHHPGLARDDLPAEGSLAVGDYRLPVLVVGANGLRHGPPTREPEGAGEVPPVGEGPAEREEPDRDAS